MAASRMAYTAEEGENNAIHSAAQPSLLTSSAKVGQKRDSAHSKVSHAAVACAQLQLTNTLIWFYHSFKMCNMSKEKGGKELIIGITNSLINVSAYIYYVLQEKYIYFSSRSYTYLEK